MKRNHDQKSNGNAWIAAALIGILVFCGDHIYEYCVEYQTADRSYQKLQEDVVLVEEEETMTSNAKNAKTKQKTKNGTRVIKGIDFEQLTQSYEDIVGWIVFEEPSEINYPIVQGEDNQEYLTKTLDADGYKHGTIFMDYENSPDFSDDNTFLYGHHMRNGTMFAQLLKYEDKAFYTQYPCFSIFLAEGTSYGNRYTYQIFAVERAQDGGPSFQIHFNEEDRLADYISYIKQNSIYDTGIEVAKDAQIVSLSTCSGGVESERFVVHGVLIERDH